MRAVKYGTGSCGPCKVTEENLKASGIEFEAIDLDDENYEYLIQEKGIRSIPTVEFYDNDGNLIETHRGLLTLEEIQTIIKNA